MFAGLCDEFCRSPASIITHVNTRNGHASIGYQFNFRVIRFSNKDRYNATAVLAVHGSKPNGGYDVLSQVNG